MKEWSFSKDIVDGALTSVMITDGFFFFLQLSLGVYCLSSYKSGVLPGCLKTANSL